MSFMEEVSVKSAREEDLSLSEEFSRELSSREIFLIVIPFVFNLLITGVSSYFEKYINQYIVLFPGMLILWAILFFVDKKTMAKFNLKILLLAAGLYILVTTAFYLIKSAYFESENASDNISSQLLIVLVNVFSFFLVWLGFQFLQKITKT